MAAFDFLSASVSLTYQIGTDDYNEPVYKATTYRNLHSGVSANELSVACSAIASLTTDSLFEISKSQKELIYEN